MNARKKLKELAKAIIDLEKQRDLRGKLEEKADSHPGKDKYAAVAEDW